MPTLQHSDLEEFIDDGLSTDVIYDGNGNTGGEPPEAVPYRIAAAAVVASPGTLAKTYYTFLRWNTEADGSGTSYSPGDTLKIPAAGVTLYAQWVCGVTFLDASNLATAPAADLDGYFVLTEDVDTTGGGDWTPIGDETTPFTGTFDGGGHTVTYVIGPAGTPSTALNQGFFGTVGADGVVKNVTMVIDNYFEAPGIVHGGVAAANNGLIEHCAVIGTLVQDSDYCGLLASSNGPTGVIRECYSVGTILGSWYTGGIVGHNQGLVQDCYSRSTILNGVNWNGGIVGIMNGWGPPDAAITNCYAAGDVMGVTNLGTVLGGLDYGPGTVNGCYYDTGFGDTDGNATGLSTAAMKTKASFVGWDFDRVWAIDGTGVINDGYPYLRYFGADTVTP